MNVERYRIKPGEKVNLESFDASESKAFKGDKEEGLAELAKLNERLEELQELLYAENKHKVLIVFQAMDAGGKDGTIRSVFEGVNPQGVKVAAFKVPTPDELAHDYLWRIHKQTPGKGEIVIFNRSHYEDVLVVRVHNIVPETVWHKRYDHIRNFEQLLADEGTTILKFYLHIDLDEQKQRLQERLDDAKKRWKFNIGDLDERKLWPQYMRAFEDAIEKTSTDDAPWYVIPANRNWYRNLVVSQIIVDTLEALKMKYPAEQEGLDNVVIE
ncbi:MAG: polyphosphate kinase 2 family protein [Caldilineaceae bacterium]